MPPYTTRLLCTAYLLCCSAAEPGAWYACLPLHVVYSYDPLPGPWQELQAEGLEQDEVGQGSQSGSQSRGLQSR